MASGWSHYSRHGEPVVLPERPAIRHGRLTSDYYQPRRPLYYTTGSGHLMPEIAGPRHRSQSQGHRPYEARPEVIINNIHQDELIPLPMRGRGRSRPSSVYEPYEEEEYEHSVAHSPYRYREHSRQRSRSRPRSREVSPYYYSREEKERDEMRKELEKYRTEKQREEEEKRIKDELMLKQVKEAEKKREEDARLKELEKAAIEKFKREQEAQAAKAKKEKEDDEARYKERLKTDLEKYGLSDKQVSVITSTNNQQTLPVVPGKVTYTKMARRHLSIETLRTYQIPYKMDENPEYVIIKRWVPEYEQDFLWNHTRKIRNERLFVVRDLELRRIKDEHDAKRLVLERRSKKKRAASPPALLSFFAGRN
ncbi:MAG: hypothetical protein M1829_000697 [Trizodia sp. TS-e1964]|nr:MAG: hypothetical protein M1829_000697 [Trizodia sp. TS-e1964]